jgi:hypothetical protein
LRDGSASILSWLRSWKSRRRREVRSKIAVLLAAVGLVLGAVSCGGMEDMEDQEDQQEQQEQDDDD